MDFTLQGKINRGRHTDDPAGRHSIRTNHWTMEVICNYMTLFHNPHTHTQQQQVCKKNLWGQLEE